MSNKKVTFSVEKTNIPALKVGDTVKAHGFVAKVVDKRDYPARIEGIKHGADGPCSQVSLKLIFSENDAGKGAFKWLAKGRDNLALMQGNTLASVYRLHKESVEPVE